MRQRHAHTWVEVDVGQDQWVLSDATPEVSELPGTTFNEWLNELKDSMEVSWQQQFLGFDMDDQVRFVESALPEFQLQSDRVNWGLVCGFVVLGLFSWIVLRVLARRLARAPSRKEMPRGRVAQAHHLARVAVSRSMDVPRSLPPVEAARWVGARDADLGQPLEALGWLMYRVRYGMEEDAHLGPEADRLSSWIVQRLHTELQHSNHQSGGRTPQA